MQYAYQQDRSTEFDLYWLSCLRTYLKTRNLQWAIQYSYIAQYQTRTDRGRDSTFANVPHYRLTIGCPQGLLLSPVVVDDILLNLSAIAIYTQGNTNGIVIVLRRKFESTVVQMMQKAKTYSKMGRKLKKTLRKALLGLPIVVQKWNVSKVSSLQTDLSKSSTR